LVPFVLDGMQHGIAPSSFRGGDYGDVHNSGGTSKETGILLAMFAATAVVGSAVFGYMGDRMPYRKYPMLLGVLALFGSTFLFLYGTQFWMFVIARCFQGLSDSCIWTLGISLIVESFPADVLGAQMSKALLFQTIGIASGAPIGAVDFIFRLLMVEPGSYPNEWFGESATPSITDCTTARKSSKIDEITIDQELPLSDEKSATASEKTSETTFNILQIFRIPRVLVALLVYFAFGIAFNVFEPTMPIHLVNEFGYNSGQIGLVFLAQLIPTFFSTPISGYAYDRFGPKLLCSGAMGMCALCTILMSIPNRDTAGGIVPLIVLFSFEGFFAAAFIVPSMPEIAKVLLSLTNGGNEGVAASYAVFNIAFCLGALVGPLLGGYLFDRLGFSWLCIIVACFLLSVAPLTLVFLGDKKLTIYKWTTVLFTRG
ncbi:major facilitator superfamily domain-containing protein, partial [Fennellomyces sp. T-0311]